MKLEELKRICDEASWPDEVCYTVPYGQNFTALYGVASTEEQAEKDALFIPAARNMLPRLIAVAEAAKGVTNLLDRHGYFESILFDALAALESDE